MRRGGGGGRGGREEREREWGGEGSEACIHMTATIISPAA